MLLSVAKFCSILLSFSQFCSVLLSSTQFYKLHLKQKISINQELPNPKPHFNRQLTVWCGKSDSFVLFYFFKQHKKYFFMQFFSHFFFCYFSPASVSIANFTSQDWMKNSKFKCEIFLWIFFKDDFVVQSCKCMNLRVQNWGFCGCGCDFEEFRR